MTKSPEWHANQQAHRDTAAAATAKRSAGASIAGSLRYDTDARKQKYIDCLNKGMTKTAARRECAIEGRVLADQTVRQWRTRDKEFAAAVDVAYFARTTTKHGAGRGGFDLEKPPEGYDGSFVSFRKYFFDYDTFPHQRKIIAAIEAAERSKNGDISLILCPPEHGKTSLLEDYICYRVALNPNIRITIVSASHGHAEKIISKIRNRMTKAGSRFVLRYGPFYEPGMEKRGKPWSTNHLTVYKADHDERDYTLEARGWTSEVQGTRCDLMLLDDLQNVRSLTQTDKMMEVVRQDFVTRLGGEAPMAFLGTRVGLGDIYDVMIEENFIDHLVAMPAINNKGEALWPERWDIDKLTRRREKLSKDGSSEDVWWRTYMQSPKMSGKGSFPETLIETAKDRMADHSKPPDCTGVVIGVDPAISGGCAVIACAYTQDRLKVIDMAYEFELGTNEAIFYLADEMARRYGANSVVIEQNAMQKGLVRDERFDEMASKGNYSIIAHQTGRLKTDPAWGIPSMADSIRRGELTIAWGTEYVQERLTPLVNQLGRWRWDIDARNLKQDTVMSLWFVHKWWKENRNYNSQAGNWNTGRALPWKPAEYAKAG